MHEQSRPPLQTPKQYLPLLLLTLLALPLLTWLLRPGFWVSGDGLHHLYRVDELRRYLSSGVFFPRWFGEFAFGYGVPVFLFYNPLSYYLALPLAPLGALAATEGVLGLTALLSAWAMYAYARRHATWPAALLAALVYLYLPYRLVDLYVRAAMAEHVAFIWFPLILWASDGIGKKGEEKGKGEDGKAAEADGWGIGGRVAAIVAFALAWAGLIATHTFSAVMFAPVSLGYLVLLAWWRRSARPLTAAVPGGLLALGLSAFFWLPLLAEQRFAGLGTGEGASGYRTHLVSLRQLIGGLRYDYTTGALDPNYYYAVGLVAVLLLIAGSAAAAIGLRRQSQSMAHGRAKRPLPATHLALFGAAVAVGALFMTTKASRPLWELLAPVLAHMQFPWRFLSVAVLGIALSTLALPALFGRAAAAETDQATRAARPLGLAVLFVIILGALVLTGLPSLPFQALPLTEADITPESFWAFDRETGQAGSTWGGEFLPIWVSEQRWALGRPPEAPQEGPTIAAPAVELLAVRPDWIDLRVDSDRAWPLRLHAYYFPGWQVRVDGEPVATAASGDLGLVTAELPAGDYQVRVRFEPTPVRVAAKWLSLFTLAVAIGLLAWHSRAVGRRGLSWAIAIGGLLLVILLAWGGTPQAAAIRPATANLEGRVLLLGAVGGDGGVAPGQRAEVTLVWLSLGQFGRDDKAFVHLVGPDGAVVAQHDGDPGGGFTPTTRWQPGEIILDRHAIDLPPDLPAGRYALRAGLYQFDPLRNLAVDPPTPDGRVDLGWIDIHR